MSYNSKVLYTTFLNQEQNDETLCQQLERIIKNFDEAHKCHGIREGRFANIKFCTGAVLQDDTWRSTNCKTFFDVNNKNFYDPSSHSLPEDVLKWVQKTIDIGTPVCSKIKLKPKCLSKISYFLRAYQCNLMTDADSQRL